ncbi:hypothetical protein EXIGLDRAFT_774557 [Exidia glandulosa HHB12029]|uniref:Uncharacterized protein n=1 Tax=Exidia glandulosa HHB12029 TaxID=1314781 RepID=A0A165EB91_EXIGL|nr:hypothetical protein EXIGLDRAFT_774557 [Exidia glandulosa HHB12029]
MAFGATGGSVIYAAARSDPAAGPSSSHHHDDEPQERETDLDPLGAQVAVTPRSAHFPRRGPPPDSTPSAPMEGESAPVHGNAQDGSFDEARRVHLPASEDSDSSLATQVPARQDSRRDAHSATEEAAIAAPMAAIAAPNLAAIAAPMV